MEYRNPKYTKADKSEITLELQLATGEWVPFTASVADVEEHGRLLFAEAEFLGDVADYVPKTVDETRQVMPSLSPRQIRLGLLNNGITAEQVTSAIDAMPAGKAKEVAKIEWEFAPSFRRKHGLIAVIGQALQLSEEQIDTMWMEATKL